MSKIGEPATLQGCLLELIHQASRQDRQWVQPLRRIVRLLDQERLSEAQRAWQALLRPMRGSFHEFFICCDNLDHMRDINTRIDHLRDRVTLDLDHQVSVQTPF
jgi:hypothetical protein